MTIKTAFYQVINSFFICLKPTVLAGNLATVNLGLLCDPFTPGHFARATPKQVQSRKFAIYQWILSNN
jgi:hypothetical protein